MTEQVINVENLLSVDCFIYDIDMSLHSRNSL